MKACTFPFRLALVPVILAAALAACGDATDSDRSVADATPEIAGEQTYRRFCLSCHASGAAGAPRTGNAAAWAPRIAQGMDVMLQHTIDGMPGMPPRGMCTRCDDDELRAAIAYMVERSQSD